MVRRGQQREEQGVPDGRAVEPHWSPPFKLLHRSIYGEMLFSHRSQSSTASLYPKKINSQATMAVKPPTPHIPLEPSALQTMLNTTTPQTPLETIPHEILHNLRYQHNWTSLSILKPPPPIEAIPSLTLTSLSPSLPRKPTTTTPILLSGKPPKPIYIHPTYQSHLLLQSIEVSTLQPEIEYVFPLALGQSFTLRLLQSAFDSIPTREPIERENGFKHQDAKRILLAMRGRQGVGGDGTVNYYVVQEGEVKPRQN